MSDQVLRGSLPLERRAASYTAMFPNYPPLCVSKGWLYGVWMIGNQYKRKHGFYGEYPPSYLPRVYSLFPDVPDGDVLHVFAGSVSTSVGRHGLTSDIDDQFKPVIIGDVMVIGQVFSDEPMRLIIADPPYTALDCTRYGTPPLNKRLALRELAKVTVLGGHLVWLDLIIPIYRKLEWKLVGTIALLTGTNRRVRMVSIFERQETSDD